MILYYLSEDNEGRLSRFKGKLSNLKDKMQGKLSPLGARLKILKKNVDANFHTYDMMRNIKRFFKVAKKKPKAGLKMGARAALQTALVTKFGKFYPIIKAPINMVRYFKAGQENAIRALELEKQLEKADKLYKRSLRRAIKNYAEKSRMNDEALHTALGSLMIGTGLGALGYNLLGVDKD